MYEGPSFCLGCLCERVDGVVLVRLVFGVFVGVASMREGWCRGQG